MSALPCPTEEREQQTVIEWAAWMENILDPNTKATGDPVLGKIPVLV
jgi:formylmethanofuran dehydrogenase subunit D